MINVSDLIYLYVILINLIEIWNKRKIQNSITKTISRTLTLDYKYFIFLKKINEHGFIDITNYDESICSNYPNAQFNFQDRYFKNIIDKFVFKKDRNNCLISGGCFTIYKENSLTKFFPEIFAILKANQDIDIYIESSNGNDYAKFYNKNLIMHLDYKMASFKIDIEKCKINFIFPNRYKNLKNIDIINDFDLDFSKIFFLYKENAMYVYYTLFDKFRILNKSFDLKIKAKFLDVHIDSLIKKKNEFKYCPDLLNKNPQALSNKFYRCSILRFYKYLSKGFFENESKQKIESLLKFYNKPFLLYLDKQKK